ncbi:LOW QUALITY PROTEIN: hypothetical protein CH63R_08914 [Colletotrichum higginsianum IMI 349063]|uniref:Uncharacterized protein n=1 Tax=Colletotrichum higginsianum (strain IMI 349063) TaxID=759273 RepID=A0A1B7Y5W7_COLHI|nr:LOW QUALITY PROTEIN: hypothetical protein CH63R_08914 [Colletotrichum higginsianum IMI 349063]OBR07393.1 LOW QUALITY PROTEIN: hypothetical protein CH63R_08914 [Colletotrichum higginsianum IMI 349063]
MPSLVGLIQTEQRVMEVRGGGGLQFIGLERVSNPIFYLYYFRTVSLQSTLRLFGREGTRGKTERETAEDQWHEDRRSPGCISKLPEVRLEIASNNGSLHVIIMPQPEDTPTSPPPTFSLFWFWS